MNTFVVGESPELSVRFSSGRLRVVNGPDGEITVVVSGKPQDGLSVEQHGDRIDIAQRPDVRRGRYEVTATVPKGVRLEASGASVDVDVDHVGEADMRTASGDIRIDRVGGDAYVKAASGDVRVEAVGGRIRISSASGDCVVGDAESDVQITCASGDITAKEVLGDAEVKTASGDVSIACCRGDRIIVKSASGDVSVGLPGGTTVAADLVSLSGSMDLPKKPADHSAGAGKPVSLKIHSMSGDITITKAES